MVSCIEEVAFRKGYIGTEQMERLAQSHGDQEYAEYLRMVMSESD